MSNDTETVKDLMTANVVTIRMDDTLRMARKIFEQRSFHHLIVVEENKPIGVLSDRDLLKHLSPFVGARFSHRVQDSATLMKRVHQMMTRAVIAIGPDVPVAEAADRMMSHHVSCLPVVDPDQTLVGILTIRDLVRWAVRQGCDEPLNA